MLYAARHFAAEGCEHYDGNGWILGFDLFSFFEDVAAVHVGQHDDELEVALGEQGEGFLLRGYLREAWRIVEPQVHIFVEDFFIHAPIVFEHEGVVF